MHPRLAGNIQSGGGFHRWASDGRISQSRVGRTGKSARAARAKLNDFRSRFIGNRTIGQLGGGKFAGHLRRQTPDAGAKAVGEVQRGGRRLIHVAIGPEGIEPIVRIDGAARIRVIVAAAVGQKRPALPAHSLVATSPQHHVATRAPGLRTGIRRRNHAPAAVGLDGEGAVVVVVVRAERRVDLPCAALRPELRRVPRPRRRGVVGLGGRREIEQHRLARGVEVELLHVNVLSLRLVVVDQRGIPGMAISTRAASPLVCFAKQPFRSGPNPADADSIQSRKNCSLDYRVESAFNSNTGQDLKSLARKLFSALSVVI